MGDRDAHLWCQPETLTGASPIGTLFLFPERKNKVEEGVGQSPFLPRAESVKFQMWGSRCGGEKSENITGEQRSLSPPDFLDQLDVLEWALQSFNKEPEWFRWMIGGPLQARHLTLTVTVRYIDEKPHFRERKTEAQRLLITH